MEPMAASERYPERIDGYDTPPELAAAIIGSVSQLPTPSYILDPAMGSGNLLAAAQARWGTAAQYLGCDVSPPTVRSASKRETSWTVGACDFLNPRSRSQCSAIAALSGHGADLILLNPPFSGRGSATRVARMHGVTTRCSVALAFTVTALQYLCHGGSLVAILPSGSLSSDKDASTWRFLRERTKVIKIARFERDAFVGAFARTSVVRITMDVPAPRRPMPLSGSAPEVRGCDSVLVTRGNVRMHEVDRYRTETGVPLVHTTVLPGPQLREGLPTVNGQARRISGPAVLLPRVGQPSLEKVTMLPDGLTIAPSDCVIAIHGPSASVAKVWDLINGRWNSMASLYQGSCAPYLTIQRVIDWLKHQEVWAEPSLPRMIASSARSTSLGAPKSVAHDE